MHSNLDEVNLSELHAMAFLSPFRVVFRAGWSSDRADFSSFSSDDEYLAPAHELFANDDIDRAIRRHSSQYASSGPISFRAKRKLRAHRSFSKMGHAQRIRLLGSFAVLPRTVDRYIKDSTHANSLKQANESIQGDGICSPLMRRFLRTQESSPFPIREELAPQWRSMFNNAATFGNYASLLEKCCFSRHFPAT